MSYSVIHDAATDSYSVLPVANYAGDGDIFPTREEAVRHAFDLYQSEMEGVPAAVEVALEARLMLTKVLCRINSPGRFWEGDMLIELDLGLAHGERLRPVPSEMLDALAGRIPPAAKVVWIEGFDPVQAESDLELTEDTQYLRI